MARGPDKGFALPIFVAPRRLTEEQQFGANGTNAKNGLRARRRQFWTTIASPNAVGEQLQLDRSPFGRGILPARRPRPWPIGRKRRLRRLRPEPSRAGYRP